LEKKEQIDRLTDEIQSQGRAMHYCASRGKNVWKIFYAFFIQKTLKTVFASVDSVKNDQI